MAVAVAAPASFPMITLRLMVAALMLSAAPLSSDAQAWIPDVGMTPGDWNDYGHALVAANRHREAIAAFERAMQLHAERSRECAWSIARSYAQLDNRKQALRWVERSIDLGFQDREVIRRAPEFAKYRGDPRLDELLRLSDVSKSRVAILTSHF